jgi:hypothetical protein
MSPSRALLLVAIALTATACHSNRNVTVHVTVRHTGHSKTIEIGSGVPVSSLLKGVQGISRGTSAVKLLSVFGRPFAKVSSVDHGDRETCWAYHAHQARTSIDALDFCIDKAQRVQRILIGEHA